jgi:predicted transcriptional regulator
VIRLFKSRELGSLEQAVMDVVWSSGGGSVHDVSAKLDRPLAYTTVMTTLDRLYKKGLLERRKAERAFLYSAAMSRAEWERQRADAFMAGLPVTEQQMLISSLVDAVGQHDSALLDELERKIRSKRRELERDKNA